jgi:hypothetical protein
MSKTTKCIVIFLATLGLITLIAGVVLANTQYVYKGVAELPLDKATLLINEQGSETIGFTAYDKESDVVLVSYHFQGNFNLASKYGIPQSYQHNYGMYALLLITLVCGFFIWFIIAVYDQE